MAKRNRAKVEVMVTYRPVNGERARLHRVMALLLAPRKGPPCSSHKGHKEAEAEEVNKDESNSIKF